MDTIGFIGFGNMASAIARGIIKEKIITPSSVFVYDIFEAALDNAAACGFNVVNSEAAVALHSSLIFLCVKPQSFTEVLPRISTVSSGKVFISIAAGISIEKITKLIGEVAVIRAMPNTPLLLASGTTALTKNLMVTQKDFSFVKQIFSSVGTVYELPEIQFNEVINVNGSTPAYIYYFVKIITDFAHDNGIDRELAMKMLCDTLIGSAKMLTSSGKSPQELIDMVSSKGGTTVAAIEAFGENGFEHSLRQGLQAALNRAVELGSM